VNTPPAGEKCRRQTAPKPLAKRDEIATMHHCVVGVAQLVELQTVALAVAGSSPVTHPSEVAAGQGLAVTSFWSLVATAPGCNKSCLLESLGRITHTAKQGVALPAFPQKTVVPLPALLAGANSAEGPASLNAGAKTRWSSEGRTGDPATPESGRPGRPRYGSGRSPSRCPWADG
jgi:hypothetical protein